MILRCLRVVPSLAIVLVAQPHARAQTAAEFDLQLAREPAEVVATTGRTVRGILDGFRDGRLHLRLATDGGEVGYSFTPAEIARLTLPGLGLEADALELLDRGDLVQAMPRLEALGRHRVRYIPVIDASRQRCLWLLAEHGAGAGDPHAVLGVVRAMAPIADTPEKQVLLIEAELEIALRTHADDEARELARRWCRVGDPSGRSALGWRVLAESEYRAGNYDRARWIALQPVTFAGHLAMRDLDRCYALAVASADRQGDCAHAHLLRREMAGRGLAWPDDPALAALGAHYPSEAGNAPRTCFFAPLPSPAPNRTTESSLTLEQVQRLPATTDLP